MKNIVYKFKNDVSYAVLRGNVKLQMISSEPDSKEQGTAYEVDDSELDKIKKAKRKQTVVINIIKDKEPLDTTDK